MEIDPNKESLERNHVLMHKYIESDVARALADPYRQDRLENFVGLIQKEFQERGYLYLRESPAYIPYELYNPNDLGFELKGLELGTGEHRISHYSAYLDIPFFDHTDEDILIAETLDQEKGLLHKISMNLGAEGIEVLGDSSNRKSKKYSNIVLATNQDIRKTSNGLATHVQSLHQSKESIKILFNSLIQGFVGYEVHPFEGKSSFRVHNGLSEIEFKKYSPGIKILGKTASLMEPEYIVGQRGGGRLQLFNEDNQGYSLKVDFNDGSVLTIGMSIPDNCAFLGFI
ncbi:hypothetical protein CMI38_05230 [Candidatus Pacearchaeota archaeon]|jgi:hypothetical protein|nr:hypothetical protein [Candidatus Pacearchaeota archaeon]|tara:strand:+ start:13057 stop:13914 length:858 start_codon:yes stop_codon:yes gene_type:complete